MAMYANQYSSGSTEEVSTGLDIDRYYSATLNGPINTEAAGEVSNEELKNYPRLTITFAAPKTAESDK